MLIVKYIIAVILLLIPAFISLAIYYRYKKSRKELRRRYNHNYSGSNKRSVDHSDESFTNGMIVDSVTGYTSSDCSSTPSGGSSSSNACD